MSTIGYINVSMEIFGGLLSLIFVICISFTHRKKEIMEVLYKRLLICNIILLFSDAAAWIFKGKSSMLSFYGVRISNFLVFTLGYVMLVLFTQYLIGFLKTKKIAITKTPLYFIRAIMVAAICLVVLSQINGMYYMIDEQNIYHRQNWFWMSQIFGVLGMILNASLIIRYRRKLSNKELTFFTVYICLPAAALLVQIMFYGIAVLYLATSICLMCMYISIQIALFQEMSEKKLELEKAKTAVMLSQIKPHFLYNALIGIKELCDMGEQKSTSKALEHFSYYLRSNLESLSDAALIPFEREVRHVKDYLYLEKIRFEEKLHIVWNLNITDFMLPPLTLQSLAENAVQHGITEKRGGGRLTIKSMEAGDTIIITVVDDGVGFDEKAVKEDGRSHVGIKNVRGRLQLQCDGTLEIESTPGKGTTAKIILPKLEVLCHESISSGR